MAKPIDVLDTICEEVSKQMAKEMDRTILLSFDQQRFFDELQAHIIVAGGRKISTQELKNMRVEDLVRTLWPNNINLVVKNNRLKDHLY